MDKRTVKVRGSAKVSGAPDMVVITFEVQGRDFDYTKCMEQLALQTDCLRQELESVGLEKECLKTTRFSINPNYEWIDQRHIFKGYLAAHDLRVDFPFTKDYLNKVLSVLGKTQSKASFRISFEIKDPEPLRRQALAEAVKNCREKALILAQAGGVALGELLHIDYSWSEIHFQSRMEINEMAVAESSPQYDIEPEDVDISDSVTTIWAIG